MLQLLIGHFVNINSSSYLYLSPLFQILPTFFFIFNFGEFYDQLTVGFFLWLLPGLSEFIYLLATSSKKANSRNVFPTLSRYN